MPRFAVRVTVRTAVEPPICDARFQSRIAINLEVEWPSVMRNTAGATSERADTETRGSWIKTGTRVGSPRPGIFCAAGFAFDPCAVSVTSPPAWRSAIVYVKRLAEAKAKAGARSTCARGAGADTVVI